MHKQTKRLHELKEKHNLTHKDIAAISYVENQTALTWLMKETKRVIPFAKLYDLEVHLNGEFRPLD